jgi:tetratricopeptide (TPR) repeat protein
VNISKKYVLTALCCSLLGGQMVMAAPPAKSGKAAAPKKAVVLAPPVQPEFSNKIFKGQVSKDAAMGEQLLLSGQYAPAQDIFQTALNKNSKDVASIVGLGFSLAVQFKLDGADAQFTKALALSPKDPLPHVGKAFVQLNRLQSSSMTIKKNRNAMLSSAEAECRTAIKLNPNIAEPYVVLGMIQKEQGKIDAAKASLSKGISLDPRFGGAYVHRGLIELKQGDNGAAVNDFKQAIAIRSSNSTAHYGLGVAYTNIGQLDDAYNELNTSLSLKNNSAPAHIAMGDVYSAQGNSVAAMKEYNAAIAIKAESEPAYLKVAAIYQNRGDLEMSAANLRSGLELSPQSIPLNLQLGDILLQLGKVDDSIKTYTSVLNMSPANVPAAEGLTRSLVVKANKEAAGAFFVSNNFESAEALLQKAIQMNPNNMELRLNEVKLRVLAGQPANLDAVGTPTTDPQRIAFAEACIAQYRFADAQQAMQTVIQNCQTAKDTLAVADIALMTRDLDSAQAAYTKASTMGDSDSQSRAKRGLDAVSSARTKATQALTLATDLARKKQYASGVDQYRNAAYLNPRLADAHLGLAETLQKFMNKDSSALREASLHYKAYIALSPNLPEKEQTKIAKKAEKCMEIAYKIDSGHPPSKFATLLDPVSNLGKKVGSGIKSALESN